MKKMEEKADKLKSTIKHGVQGNHGVEHKDEAQSVNDSPVVRSGLVEPTVMGTPVLAEDLYATHSDIVDPPVRSFAQWEDEERHGAPPPLSTGYETHHLTDLQPHVGHRSDGEDVNREQLEGGIWKPAALDEEDAPPPLSAGYGTHLITDPAHVGHDTYGQDVNREQLETGGNEVGITGVLKSFDKMKVFNEPNTKSSQFDQNEPKVYTRSHDQFAPDPPLGSHTQRISTVATAISNKATAVKNSVSKLTSLGENESQGSPVSHKTNLKSSLSHKVADTLSGTLDPVYETVAGAGSSVMSKMQGHDDSTGSPATQEEGTVKDYLVDTFKPGDDDKVLSQVITHAFHRGKND
ncbi:hypothetical protein R6Q57_021309 [Mikania cordata]